jgi:hypothetical protein
LGNTWILVCIWQGGVFVVSYRAAADKDGVAGAESSSSRDLCILNRRPISSFLIIVCLAMIFGPFRVDSFPLAE